MLLFIYGSLLRGAENHAVIGGARFAGAARTAPRYTLVDLGPYPALLLDGNTAITGELYEVGEALLGALDDFEGHPDHYFRAAIELEYSEAGEARRVEAYALHAHLAAGCPAVASGDWRAHRSF